MVAEIYQKSTGSGGAASDELATDRTTQEPAMQPDTRVSLTGCRALRPAHPSEHSDRALRRRVATIGIRRPGAEHCCEFFRRQRPRK